MSKTNTSNLSSIPTWKLKETLSHPHTQGIDGQDYGPVRHELEVILWSRQDADSIKELKEFELKQRELFKHNSKSHKKN